MMGDQKMGAMREERSHRSANTSIHSSSGEWRHKTNRQQITEENWIKFICVCCVRFEAVCVWVGRCVCVADWCSIFSFIHLFSDSINLSIFHRVFCDFQSIWRRKEIFIDVDRNRGGSWLCFFAAEIHLFSSFLAAARLLLPNREKWFGLMRQHWASRVAALPCAR